ncbi:hypothetical protein Tco_1532588 [Tanacetum coccineum]
MSSPNHPTSDIEDAFSSNFSDYIPASPDYVPASPGKTYSSSSNNSFGVVLIVSPTLSLFHDGPMRKVAYIEEIAEIPGLTQKSVLLDSITHIRYSEKSSVTVQRALAIVVSNEYFRTFCRKESHSEYGRELLENR